MRRETLFDKALRLKGYGSYEEKISESEYRKIEKERTVEGGLRVKPTIIRSLQDYITFIDELDSDYKNPVFYRGQGNANYTINPTALRLDPKNEKLMIDSFSRRFSNEIEPCVNDMARLALMQHYGLSTRALDITENPFAA